MLPLTFLSSAFLPATLMPGWMQGIARCNPLNWAAQAGRAALNANTDWAAVAVRGVGLLALAVACVRDHFGGPVPLLPEERLTIGGAPWYRSARYQGAVLLAPSFDQPGQMERLAGEVVPHLS